MSASSASMCSACTTPGGPLVRRPVAIRRSAYGSGSTSNIRAMPCRPSTSHSSTSLPCDASASASAAATVDLPVPPLPVTTCSRTRDQSELTAGTVGGASREAAGVPKSYFLSSRLPSGRLPFGPLRISQKPREAGLGLSSFAQTAARVPIWATFPFALNVILPRLPIR